MFLKNNRIAAVVLGVVFLFSGQGNAAELLLDRPAQPVSEKTFLQEESNAAFSQPAAASVQAAESQAFLSGGSPLSAASPVFNGALASAPPVPETNFASRSSAGVYEVTLDNYFDALFQAVEPGSATSQFNTEDLINVDLQILQRRTLEQVAGLYDFVVYLPTRDARGKLKNLNHGALVYGIEGLGAAVKDDIQGLGENAGDQDLVNRLNQVFTPFFEDNFSLFLAGVNDRGAQQGMAWIDIPSIESTGITTLQYKQFVLLQEMAHRWGIHLSSTVNDPNPLGILGRDDAHWDAFFDAGSSPMDGIDWQDNGDGTFTLKKIYGISISDLLTGGMQNQTSAFNDFDLYAMGLLAPASVTSSFVIDSPKTLSGSPLDTESLYNLLSDYDFLFNPVIRGTRRNVSIQDITAINGTRTPNSSASQKNFSVAFVTVKTGKESASELSALQSKISALASSLPAIWNSATRGLSTLSFGFTAAAFDFFRTNIASLFDDAVTEIRGTSGAGLDSALVKGQAGLSSITSLQNQTAQIESLLAPLQARVAADPFFQNALGNIPARVAALKNSIQSHQTQIQSALNNASGLAATVQIQKTSLLQLAASASVSGILPVGFGVTADNTLKNIDAQYSAAVQQVSSANQSFESQLNAYKQELDQILFRLGPDSSAPSGTFTINDGALVTSSGALKLKVHFTDSQLGPAVMRYSKNWGTSWSEFQAYAENDWNITEWQSQGTNFGLLVQVCDYYWNCSSAESHITYHYADAAAPSGDFKINNGAAVTSDGKLSLQLNFTDAQTQVAAVRYSLDLNKPWSAWSSNTQQLQVETWPPNGTRLKVWVQACDTVWNCVTKEQSILFQYNDSTPPSGTLMINGGAAQAAGSNMTLNLNFQERETRLGSMRYSVNGGVDWSAFREYAEIWQIALLSPEVTVQVCDAAWNCSTASDSISVG